MQKPIISGYTILSNIHNVNKPFHFVLLQLKTSKYFVVFKNFQFYYLVYEKDIDYWMQFRFWV